MDNKGAQDTQNKDARIKLPNSESPGLAGNMSAAVSHLNKEVARGKSAHTIAGYDTDNH